MFALQVGIWKLDVEAGSWRLKSQLSSSILQQNPHALWQMPHTLIPFTQPTSAPTSSVNFQPGSEKLQVNSWKWELEVESWKLEIESSTTIKQTTGSTCSLTHVTYPDTLQATYLSTNFQHQLPAPTSSLEVRAGSLQLKVRSWKWEAGEAGNWKLEAGSWKLPIFLFRGRRLTTYIYIYMR